VPAARGKPAVDAESAGALRLGFTSPVNVSMTDDVSEYPVLTHDGQHLYVAWEETYDNLLMLSRSTTGACLSRCREPSCPGRVQLRTGAPRQPRRLGRAHRLSPPFDLYSGGAEIAHAGSSDAAVTFPQFSIVSSVDDMNSYAPSIAAGWGLAVAWSNVHLWTGAATIEIALSVDAGATFSASKRVDAADLDAEECPSVALGSHGSVFVAWKVRYQPIVGQATEDILFARSSDGGETSKLQ